MSTVPHIYWLGRLVCIGEHAWKDCLISQNLLVFSPRQTHPDTADDQCSRINEAISASRHHGELHWLKQEMFTFTGTKVPLSVHPP